LDFFEHEYNILAKEDVKEETVYAYDIALRDKETGELVDGERFVIKQMPRQAILPVIDVKETDRGYLLKATNVNEAANYIWYNSTGEKVGSGQEVNIIPSEKEQKYRLMVEAESDGAINYADITLNSFFAIKSTSPNPFTSQLTITLSTPATDDIEFRLTPVNTVGKAESYRMKPGDSEITIKTSEYNKGIYVVSLLKNGKILDTRQIIHE